MKTIVILMDSLNRHMLKAYNKNAWVQTPTIDAFSEDSITFDGHWAGSLPCMPARRDLFTGRLNFLERCWGPIEPFDITLQDKLREKEICSHMITDHTHYVETGGENYLQKFDTWEVIRGQEHDAWVSRVDKPALPDDYYGKADVQYELNRTMFNKENDYPTPKTFDTACRWVEDNKGADDFFLMVEVFDPHEPFDCPEAYTNLYDDTYEGPRYEWSGYNNDVLPSDAEEHLRKKYAGTLTMTDKWLGKFLETLKENDMYEDSLIIFTSDHGHLLGEHGWTGKNLMHSYNEISHLPLMVHMPGSENSGERIGALTQNIDIMPTLLSYYDIDEPDTIRGYSLRSLMEGSDEGVREAAIFGYHGRSVNVTDGSHTYYRAPVNQATVTCYNYCAIPTSFWRFLGNDAMDEIEMGRFLKHTKYPVYKIPATSTGPKATLTDGLEHVMTSMLFDAVADEQQTNPLNDPSKVDEMIGKMKKLMGHADAPDEQYERLGI